MHNNSFKREAGDFQPANARGAGPIPGQGTGISQAARRSQKIKKQKNKIREKQKLHLAVYLKETFPASLPTPLYV